MSTCRYAGLFAGALLSLGALAACSSDDGRAGENVASTESGLSTRFLRDVQVAREAVFTAKQNGTVLTPESLVEILRPPQESVAAIRERLLAPDADPAAVSAELGDREELQKAAREYYELFEEIGIELPFDIDTIGAECPGEMHEQCAAGMAPDLGSDGVESGGSYSTQWYICQGVAGVWVGACFSACPESSSRRTQPQGRARGRLRGSSLRDAARARSGSPFVSSRRGVPGLPC